MKEIPKKWIIGIDEVGRGPLAGPVYVCGVVMNYTEYKKSHWVGLNDSKKMSAKNRDHWYIKANEMERKGNICIALASHTAHQIDTRGISWCIRDSIQQILVQLDCDPNATLVMLDGGLKAPKEYVHQQTIIKGDQKHRIISLASVIAKVTRDAVMTRLALKHPEYLWDQNKGYGTKAHIHRLKKHGRTPLHRTSFLTRILDIKQ